MHKSQEPTLGRAVLETAAPFSSLRLLFWGFGKGRPTRMLCMLGRLCHPLPLQQTLKEAVEGDGAI